MSGSRRLVEESAVLLDGPWQHRDVSANGIRLHVVEAGSGPLVVLLHGFPQFWWAWRHQIETLSRAGLRVVAADLRGYAASDKPPRGYDAMTLADDVAGLVRALGEPDAVVAGAGIGGAVAWTVAAAHPSVVRRLAVLSSPHPLRWLPGMLRHAEQRRLLTPLLRFQLPWHPERWLVRDDAAAVGALLAGWGGAGFPTPEQEARYRAAMQILGAPHCSVEYFRWALRSLPRADGRRFRATVRRPVRVPTLHLHGAEDRVVLPVTAADAGRFVDADYDWRLVPGAGHFLAEEAAELVSALLLRWCRP